MIPTLSAVIFGIFPAAIRVIRLIRVRIFSLAETLSALR